MCTDIVNICAAIVEIVAEDIAVAVKRITSSTISILVCTAFGIASLHTRTCFVVVGGRQKSQLQLCKRLQAEHSLPCTHLQSAQTTYLLLLFSTWHKTLCMPHDDIILACVCVCVYMRCLEGHLDHCLYAYRVIGATSYQMSLGVWWAFLLKGNKED